VAPRRDAVDALYTVHPDDFARAREAALREGALATVKSHRKPTIAVWAVNQAARRAPQHVKAFLAAVDRLKRVQLRHPAELPEAMRASQATVARVVAEAKEAVTGIGKRWTPALLRRVSETVRGAASSSTERDHLVEGTLERELTAPGFEVFGDERPTGRRKLRVVPTKPPERDDLVRRRAEQLEAEAAERERQARTAASEAMQARERLRDLEQKARDARRAASRSGRTAQRARRQAK
jgi:hypothetical protein